MVSAVNGALIEGFPNPVKTVIRADAAVLNQHWEWLREKMLILKAKVNRKMLIVRWLPEQVRMEIIRGFTGASTVELFLALGHDDTPIGFAVTSHEANAFTHVPVDLFLWLIWTNTPRCLEGALPYIEEIARLRGCTAIETISPRMALMNRVHGMGLRVKSIIYRKELVRDA